MLAGDGCAAGTQMAYSSQPVKQLSVTVPTLSPASFKPAVTFPKVWPTKLGMTKAWGEGGCDASKLILGTEMLPALGAGS